MVLLSLYRQIQWPVFDQDPLILILGWSGQFWDKYSPVISIEIIIRVYYYYYYYYYTVTYNISSLTSITLALSVTYNTE